MEQPDTDAVLGRHVPEVALGLVDLPLAGHHAGFLVGVRVAQHDFLDVAAQPDQVAVGRNGQQLVHDLRRGTQLLHGLQQRREPDLGVGSFAEQVDQACLAGQDGRSQDVVRATGHGNDVGLDDVRTIRAQGAADLTEDVVRAVSDAVELNRVAGQRPAGGQLRAQHLEAFLAAQLHVADAGATQPVHQLADGVVMVVGVLADVQGGQVQPEGRDGAADAGQRAVGGERRRVVAEGQLQQFKVGQEFLGGAVVAAVFVVGVCGHTLARVDELGLDAREFEAVRLLCIELQDAPVKAGKLFQVHLDGVQQALVRTGQRGGVGQDGNQFVHHADADADGVLVLDLQDFPGDRGRHVGVAVPVAADPGTKTDGCVLGREGDAVLTEQFRELREHLGHGVGQDAAEVVDRVAGLVHGGGAHLAQLVGLPHLVDDLRKLAVLPAARGGALLRRLGQDIRELADLVQHGTSRGLGGMSGEDGADVQPVDHFLEYARPGLRGDFGDGLGQPAVLLRPGPQAADPVDLLGRVGQVEVEREGTDQVGGLLDWQGAEQFTDLFDDVVRAPRAGGIGTTAGGFLGLLGEEADLLNQLQELGPVLAHQGFTQQSGDAPDIGPQFRGEVGCGIHCSVSHGNCLSRVRTWLVHCAGYCEPRY